MSLDPKAFKIFPSKWNQKLQVDFEILEGGKQ
jgi:hypothetical protein